VKNTVALLCLCIRRFDFNPLFYWIFALSGDFYMTTIAGKVENKAICGTRNRTPDCPCQAAINSVTLARPARPIH
jgi:hypothetical protein